MASKMVRLKPNVQGEIKSFCEETGFTYSKAIEYAWNIFRKSKEYYLLRLYPDKCNDNNEKGEV